MTYSVHVHMYVVKFLSVFTAGYATSFLSYRYGIHFSYTIYHVHVSTPNLIPSHTDRLYIHNKSSIVNYMYHAGRQIDTSIVIFIPAVIIIIYILPLIMRVMLQLLLCVN